MAPSDDKRGEASEHDTLVQASDEAGNLSGELLRARVRGALFGRDRAGAFRIGKFLVGKKLGEGGMGAIYSAYDEELDRRVAIKVLRTGAGVGTEGKVRLLREAQSLAKLSHPNVVQVYEVGTHDDQVFVAMEYVRGVTLTVWLEGDRSRTEKLNMLTQAARGLAAAHAAGLVHRDFKPDNVMVGNDGRVRVLDFGLARPPSEDEVMVLEKHHSTAVNRRGALLSTPLTETGAIMGTPAYMAPEQHVGRETDARTDQFSFSVTLYEALYGERPFAGKTLGELAAAVLGGDVLDAPRASTVPMWLREVVLRGLDRKPERRYVSMNELVAALEGDPAKRRRRLGFGLAGVALIGGALAAILSLARDDGAGCLDPVEHWAGVWDDAVRSSVEARIGRAAGDDWARLETRLDEHVAAWTEVASSNCKSRNDDGADPVPLALETLCLETSVDEVAALVGLLQSADTEVASRALRGSEEIEAPGLCRGGGKLVHRPLPPRDPTRLSEYRRLRAELRTADILGGVGRFDDQQKMLKVLEAETIKLGFAGLAAENTLKLAGVTQENIRRGFAATDGEVIALFRKSFSQAQAAGDDVVAARAAAGQCIQLVNRGEFEEAERWLPIATGLAERTGDALAAHHVETARGALALGRGQHAEALKHMEKALAMARKAEDRGPMRSSLTNVLVVAAHDPKRRLRAAREAWQWHVENYGPDHPASMQMGGVLVDLLYDDDPEAALRLLDDLVPSGRRAKASELSMSQAALLTEVYYAIDETQLAIEAGKRWFELAQDDTRTRAGASLVRLYVDAREVEASRRILEQSDPTKALRMSNDDLNLQAARVALLEEDPERALTLLESVERKGPRSETKARALLMLGRPREGLALLERSGGNVPDFRSSAQLAAVRVLEARIRYALHEPEAVALGQDACGAWLSGARATMGIGDDMSVCEGVFKPPQ